MDKRNRAWIITLLAIGSPLWLSLLISAIAVVLAVYISLWAVIVSLWAVFGALVGCAVGGILTAVGLVFLVNGYAALAMLGCGAVCAGLSILIFLGCKAATKATIVLTGKIIRSIAKCFSRKEAAS